MLSYQTSHNKIKHIRIDFFSLSTSLNMILGAQIETVLITHNIMFCLRNKKSYFQICTLFWRPVTDNLGMLTSN